MSEGAYYRKGLGNREAIDPWLARDYHSRFVEWLRDRGYEASAGDTVIRLAREFGFCYGVERAVEYAYETREKFPDRRVFLTGEIIHNPRVNRRLGEMQVGFLPRDGTPEERFRSVLPEDVVILPAFGVTVSELAELRRLGCILVDTTCGSVLNVWKNVDRYAQDGYTAVIHGKYEHEETRATSSRTGRWPEGRYIVVRDPEETERAARYIESGGDRDAFLASFGEACGPGFDPDADLVRIGLANQTTMLSSESLAIAERLKQAMIRRYGEAALGEHFRAFDTICTATQDRQDAVGALLASGVDLMLVLGGYNSSNTTHLVEIASRRTPTYHIDSASCLVSAEEIVHKPFASAETATARGWLPKGRAVIGITAGASTPNSEIGETLARLFTFRGIDPDALLAEDAE